MNKFFEQKCDRFNKFTYNRLITAAMAFLWAFCIVSCDNNEPENNDGYEPVEDTFSANDLAGQWILTKNIIQYSKVDPSKQDEEIIYSGISDPRYHFYEAKVSDENVISIVEVSAFGNVIGRAIQLELNGYELKTLDGGVAGTITYIDKHKDMDNLRIEWNEDYSPLSLNTPVLSYYLISTGLW